GWAQWAAIRDHNWNCVLNPTVPDGQPRLFDLTADPDEKVNVAGNHPDIIADCRRQLEGLIGAPFPVRYKHQPEAGDYMTFSSFFKRRARLGLPFTQAAPEPARLTGAKPKKRLGIVQTDDKLPRRKSA